MEKKIGVPGGIVLFNRSIATPAVIDVVAVPSAGIAGSVAAMGIVELILLISPIRSNEKVKSVYLTPEDILTIVCLFPATKSSFE